MEKKKCVPAKLQPEVYKALEDIVGPEYISQDRATVECYSKFSVDIGGTLKKHAKDPSNIPACIVLPGTTEEVQSIMRVCNRYRVKVIPFTNGMITFNGPPTPDPTVCVHVSRMNKVLEINEDTMTARLEAYADYAQLQAEAMKKGLWNGGSPLATTLCKLSSQSAFAGIWQTDHKYGTLSRNIISIKLVTPTGEIFITGSDTVSGMDTFWEYGPGPDLYSLIRGSGGTTGIITEIVLKLHTWPGGEELPEPPAGRPCIQTFMDAQYDTGPAPKRHKLLWVEFNDLEAEIAALRKIGQAGIGAGLNATGVYNAYYCSQTQDMTLDRVKNKFFPAYNLYVILEGTVSEKQIEYEENVVRDIIREVGGTFLSEEHKPDVLHALAPWNLDCIRHVTGYRMNRHAYCGSNILGGPVDTVARKTREVWSKALNTFGETYVTDRGGMDDTPFLYSSNHGGRFWLTEADVYPDMNKPELLERGQAMVVCGIINTIVDKYGPGANGLGVSIEPVTSFMPEVGPNAYRLFRKIRDVFDPNGICATGRQIFSKEEYDAFPEAALAGLNKLRQMHGAQPVVKET
ncbi:MAG: FAD-binding oxidoreductase [Pseudomonadota bacterium]